MLGKSTKINFIEAVLLVVVFILGVWIVTYFLNASKNSKLEIANILHLDIINEATIDEDMKCFMGNGEVYVEYYKQKVYQAYLRDDGTQVAEGIVTITDDVPMKGMTVLKTRDATANEKRIEKLVERIDEGYWKIINIPATIFLTILLELVILSTFEESKIEKKKEEKNRIRKKSDLLKLE